jgi:xanthine dehydrogenase YagR molybdenum-binding subunit
VPRLDGPAKVSGRAKYTYDIQRPGLLYGKILRCPHAHAKVGRVDTSRAEALPGVRAVEKYEGQTARFAGWEVAAVAADTEEIAEDALRLIQVEYERLDHVVKEDEALKSDAPAVRGRDNTRRGEPQEWGNLAEGRAAAAVTVEATYRTQVQTHTCLETHGLAAEWGDDGSLTAWSSTQGIFAVRDALASHFQLDASKVRVICEHMGGGFGSKFGPEREGIIAASLARQARRPVKLMLDRKEDHLCGGNRPSAAMKVTAGATRDGKLTFFDAETYGTGGIGGGSDFPAPYIYRVPHGRRVHTEVFINAGEARAMRAPGCPQASFMMESLMDELADKLGMDPLKFRQRNDPFEIRQRQYDMGAERIGWSRRQPNGSSPGPLRHGLGCAATSWGGGGQGTQAECRIHPDGSVEVNCGTQDLGTGVRTAIAVIAAEGLGLPPGDPRVNVGDTTLPPSGASGGSTTMASVAPAIKTTVDTARAKLFERVASALDAQPDALEVGDGKVFVRGHPERSLTWKQACARLGTESLAVHGEWVEGLSGSGVGGVQFAEVEVDEEAGRVRVVKIVALQDCGLVVDKLTAESQVLGAVTQGIGYALLEDRIMDTPTGLMLNPNMEDYKVPGSREIPEIDVVLQDMPERGVIGIGEPPVIPTAAAIANAVANALGVRIRELPITPDKVLNAVMKRA